VQDEITRYGPFALAVLAVSLLVAKYPGHLGLSRERVRSSLLTYNTAFVLYVALDLISGRALTSMTDLPRAAAVLLFAIAVLAVVNVMYLLVRRRAPR
jgi:hypothetical protein